VPVLLGGRFDAPQTFYSIVSGMEEPPPLRRIEPPEANLTSVHALVRNAKGHSLPELLVPIGAK
jgi:hypothetical protein